MNTVRIIILIIALSVSAVVLWRDLPIEYPGAIFKIMLLFGKMCVILAVAVFAFIFAGGKKKSS